MKILVFTSFPKHFSNQLLNTVERLFAMMSKHEKYLRIISTINVQNLYERNYKTLQKALDE